MRKARIRLLPALLAALASASALAEDSPFVWVVQGPSAQHCLVGSVHALPARAHPLPQNLDRCYESAGTLVLESESTVEFSDLSYLKNLDSIADDRAGGLRESLDATTWTRLQTQLEGLKLQPELMSRFRPWIAADLLMMFRNVDSGRAHRLEFSPEYYYYQRAFGDLKTVAYLDDRGTHVAARNRMSEAASTQYLQAFLDQIESEGGERDLAAHWRAGDTAAVSAARESFRRQRPDLYRSEITNRNRRWEAVIARRLQDRTPQMFVVHVFNLTGRDGLVELLRQRGIRFREK